MTSGSDYYKLDLNLYSDHLQPPSRQAYLHIPETYDAEKPEPLIIGLHGKRQPPSEFANHTRFPEFGYTGIIVFPEGIKLQWTGDPEAPRREEVDDIAFINVLIDHLQRGYSIDSSRIYVAGFSNGGGLAALLACDATASVRIAAFAISSGAFYTDPALKEPLFSQCHPTKLPVPILEFHGDSDPVIHYDGKTTPDGVTYNLLDWMKGWAVRNGCKDGDHKTIWDGQVKRYSWQHDGGEVLLHYYIHGFGHGWPSTYPLNNDEQRHGPTCFDGTPVVLDFYAQFRVQDGNRLRSVGSRSEEL